MTGKLFKEWPFKLDKQFANAEQNIILLIENWLTYPEEIKSELKFIKLAFFLKIWQQNENL